MTSKSMIVKNLELVREKVAQYVSQSAFHQQCTLVAVSKTKPIEDLQQVYDAGQRHFGENYVQEIIEKAPELPSDIQWHFIGHLQSRKAKALVHQVPNLYMIETLDSIKLANFLQKACAEQQRAQTLRVMIQVNTSDEVQKSGVAPEECLPLIQHIQEACSHLEFCGLMTIGKIGDTTTACFERLVACRKEVAQALNKPENELELSMGMSGDFEAAIALGSTNVRIGSTIFGARDYSKRN